MGKPEASSIGTAKENGLPRKRIVVLDKLIMGQDDMKRLKSLGEVTFFSDNPKDTAEILQRIGNSEIVVTGATPIKGEVVRQAPNLEMIAVWSTGYNHIDVVEASNRGVVVCNVPGGTAVSVAEHGIALALALAKRLPEADRHVREGGYDWDAFWAMELAGKTFGVVGTGAIGSHIAKLARCLGCRVLAVTKHPSAERAARIGVEYVSLDSLMRESDIICLSTSLTPETEGMIGQREFGLMVRKPILVNVARGKLIDQKALLQALRVGQIRGAGLDVLAEEPPGEHEDLLREERVIFTPHMAGYTPDAMANLTRVCCDNIAAYLRGAPQNVIV